ncbi:UNVERIFIED_CONTAM: hypothetical protein Sradi_5302100 [Sesamum radiatum]|uniref:Integrase catalytic domain-containing protein n=1 Tax=Sesamum radiatum TaxID=300843 RepID=A0AAW2LQF6_SESRA
MTRDKSKFVHIDTKVTDDVCFGDDTKVEIKGKGTVILATKSGDHKLLHNVYYIPKMKNNILRIGQLMESGHKVKMEDKYLWLRDHDDRLVAKVSMTSNRMFKLNVKTAEAKCLQACINDSSWIWNMRFGHLNFEGFKMLGEKNMHFVNRMWNSTSHDVPRTPQQNGVAKRKNRTVLNMARTMLKSKEMTKEFWAEAVACAVYLSNRSLTRSLEKITPQEAWIGWKPNVKHLRVFGSICYVHVPEQQKTKFDDRSKKMVFLGYDESSKGYKCFNLIARKVVICRDVEFEEDASWNWNIQKEEMYHFLPHLEAEENEEQEVECDNSTHSTPSSSDQSPRYHSINDIYNATKE